jgi:lipopolysaccharide export LptBFGC system permease protein LptF
MLMYFVNIIQTPCQKRKSLIINTFKNKKVNFIPKNGTFFQIKDSENYTITKVVIYLPNLENMKIISKYGQKERFS